MKKGDLVKLVKVPPEWDKHGFQVGDLAVMVDVDWEDVIGLGPTKEKGRGRFWFMNNNVPKRWSQFPMACYSNFEVVSQ